MAAIGELGTRMRLRGRADVLIGQHAMLRNTPACLLRVDSQGA